MHRQAVAGVDSSTQQTKLVVVVARSGELIRTSARPHPDGTEIDAEHWWQALEAADANRPEDADALSITAQQHTTIFLDEHGDPARNAILWNDLRAADSADALVDELGVDAWLDRAGLVPDSAHPVSKLRWLTDHEPETAARVESALLPHDWLTWRVLDRAHPPTTDRSDASTTGYWSATTGAYDAGLLRHAFGRELRVPALVGPGEPAGVTGNGLVVGSGSGDNPATHFSLDTAIGDVVISVGTSATVSMRTDAPARDRNGVVDTMADVRSGFIPMVTMLNGARVLTSTAQMLGVSLTELDALAGSGTPDAAGIIALPFLDGERNPRRPVSDGTLFGISRASLTPNNIARAAMLGLGCATANAVDALVRECGPARRIFLVGGGSRSATLCQIFADLLQRPVLVPQDREHAAFGAARQAAWALLGDLPQWPELPTREIQPVAGRPSAWVAHTRANYNARLTR